MTVLGRTHAGIKDMVCLSAMYEAGLCVSNEVFGGHHCSPGHPKHHVCRWVTDWECHNIAALIMYGLCKHSHTRYILQQIQPQHWALDSRNCLNLMWNSFQSLHFENWVHPDTSLSIDQPIKTIADLMSSVYRGSPTRYTFVRLDLMTTLGWLFLFYIYQVWQPHL